ncbi:MAG: methyl-accepting chemotaxis sensory transducer [Lacrimispora sp.]|nr:methyl-accepting chemotaxis sensory transducer [Lacrimispora sp.]
MKNLKIGKRIAVSFGVIFILFIVVSGTSLYSLIANNSRFVEFYNNGHEVSMLTVEMRHNVESAAKNVGYATMISDLIKKAKYIDQSEADLNELKQNLQHLKDKYKGDKALVDDIEKALSEAEPFKEEVFTLAKDNRTRQATEVFFESLEPLFNQIQDDLIQISDAAKQSANSDFSRSQSDMTGAEIIVILLQIIGAAATIILAVTMTKSIVVPVKAIEKAAAEMSKGSLHVELDYHSKDELGGLGDSMRFTILNIGSIIDDIIYLLGSMAAGDFTVTSKNHEQYVLDYEPILLTIRNIRDNLSDALSRINESADLVANGSEQVSSGAQALSQGATEQASSIQELAATINDISNQINKNAENAKEARLRSEEAAFNVTKSNQKMLEMNQAMTEINTKSSEIGKIIKTIEDIAFQTNILALNAAVEAARAGEAGKGFAVVADEVRNLASKSGEAAKNTTILIEESLQAVENGSRITAETARAMQEVVEGSRRINMIIEEISAASDKQATAVNQVTLGIDQISSVVQTTSATAEQSAAASEELSGQAQIMKSLVQQFKLHEGTAVKRESKPDFSSVYQEEADIQPIAIDPVYFEDSSSYKNNKY